MCSNDNPDNTYKISSIWEKYKAPFFLYKVYIFYKEGYNEEEIAIIIDYLTVLSSKEIT